MADDQTPPSPTPGPAPDSSPEPSPGEAAGAAPKPAKKSPRKAAKGTKATKAGAAKAARDTEAEKANKNPTEATKSTGGGRTAEPGPAPRKSTGAAQRKPKPSPRKAAPSPSSVSDDRPTGPASQPAEAREAQTEARPVARAAPGGWAEAAWEALRDPDRPAHRLAELAVAELGPRAAAWADWLRRTYPGAPALGIARLAAQQARRQHWALLATEVAGPLAPALHLPGIAAVHALLVLRTAAAYGHDPTDPARAAELLDLLGLGEDASWFDRLSMVGTALGRVGLRHRLAGAVRLALTFGEEHDHLERLAHRAALRYRRSTGETYGSSR
jgi:hypothetical protein